jgi:hypothetical protein
MNCASVVVSFALCTLLGSDHGDILAIRKYWSTTHTASSSDSESSISNRQIERVEKWPFMDMLRTHRVYAFKEHEHAHSSWAVVTVDDSGNVEALGETEQFNRLIASEALRLRSAEEALEAAKAYLRVRFFAGTKLWGWDLGVNVIEKVDQVPFGRGRDGQRQRKKVERLIRSNPSGLQDDNTGRYRFVVLAWSPYSGNLDKYEVVVASGLIEKFSSMSLAERVGVFGGY